jgi:hypothetical protein
MKAMALLDSLSASSGEDEDGSEASSNVPNTQRNLFGNSGNLFGNLFPNTQRNVSNVPGIEDL